MKILVILAAFNGEKYIKEQVDSILFQKDVSLDVFIYDDVSNDRTIDVLESFSDNNRVKLIRNLVGTGSAANNFFNAIQELSKETFELYDVVALSDQDDIWLPNKLKVASDCLRKNNASLYCSNLVLWDEALDTKSILKRSHKQKRFDYLFESGSAGCTYVFSVAFCLELKQVIQKTNYLQWKFFSHDWFIYFFARANNYKVFIDSNATIKYRMHSNNLHGYLNKKTLWASLERLKVVQAGWYHEHINGFNHLLQDGTVEKNIYAMFTKNYFSRLFVIIKYNFSLNRSVKKSLQFFIINAIPFFKKST
ncbi:MAG: rhamnosyltransferase [Sediminicola sp.]|jgi:rhamnosyltransferase|tara:strand:- start:9141 stop:10064 length:924 start_codon:yes stop_codon:yes gene_type:complete